MSISKNVTLWCDFKDCNNNFIGFSTARLTRKEAKKLGWKFVCGKISLNIQKTISRDYCPKCSQKI